MKNMEYLIEQLQAGIDGDEVAIFRAAECIEASYYCEGDCHLRGNCIECIVEWLKEEY